MGRWTFHLLPEEVGTEGIFLLMDVYLLFMLAAEVSYLRADKLLLRPARWSDRQHLYLLTPLVVLLHELGHAFFLTLFSTAPVHIHYRVFYGFTHSAGFATLSAPHRFWVALGGTLFAVAAYHAVALAFLYAARRSPLQFDSEKELHRRAAHVVYFQQGLYALVWYPLLSLPLGSFGDFSVVFSFGATPWLSLGWAVAHAALCLALLRVHAALYGPQAELAPPPDAAGAFHDAPSPSALYQRV